MPSSSSSFSSSSSLPSFQSRPAVLRSFFAACFVSETQETRSILWWKLKVALQPFRVKWKPGSGRSRHAAALTTVFGGPRYVAVLKTMSLCLPNSLVEAVRTGGNHPVEWQTSYQPNLIRNMMHFVTDAHSLCTPIFFFCVSAFVCGVSLLPLACLLLAPFKIPNATIFPQFSRAPNGHFSDMGNQCTVGSCTADDGSND
jgi:hypothetical protein